MRFWIYVELISYDVCITYGFRHFPTLAVLQTPLLNMPSLFCLYEVLLVHRCYLLGFYIC
jgi:hypothetical protein